MLKHNKKRNIKIIYEQLISLMTNLAASGHKNEANHVLDIVKKHYGKNTLLGRELKLFESVLKPTQLEKQEAEKVLTEALSEAASFNIKEIEKTQNALIKDINEQLSKDLFKIPVKDYKLMASTQILFNEARNNAKYTTPNERVKIKNLLVERISEKLPEQKEEVIDNFTLKVILNKFNQKYSKLMNEDQKEILSSYSLFLVNQNSEPLKKILTEKASKVQKTLKEHLNDKFEDAEIGQLIKEAHKDVSQFNVEEASEETIYKLMRYFDIIEDLNSK